MTVCPRVEWRWISGFLCRLVRGKWQGRRGYPPEFRRKMLDLLEGGRTAADLARELDISAQTIHTWRRQARIDRGLEAGLTSCEKAELATANRRIAELETELQATRGRSSSATRRRLPKTARSHRGDVRRRHPGRGRLPGPERVGVRLLRPS
ncbi:transposase [Nonomuraea sp. NPDC049709]|uniref:transposase n=1 Tax=Nonomuraea sp. NPDC049709 TaxID=3154736 RepID=UPI00343390BB